MIFQRFLTLICLVFAPLSAMAACLENLQSDTPSARFSTQNEGTLIDRKTGLMWKRCAEGYRWQDNTCVISEEKYEFTWQEALERSAQMDEYAGHSGWRLPNKNELNSIVERACFEPSINPDLFPNTQAITFWTNTPNTFNASFAWALEFRHGAHITIGKNKLFGVRLVREYSAD